MLRQNGKQLGLLLAAGLAVVLGMAQAPVSAAEKESGAHLAIELNRLDAVDDACRATFVIGNQMASDLKDLSFEIVFFGKDQRLLRLMSFAAGAVPDKKTVVRQFDIAGVACPSIGRALLNAVPKCDGSGLSPESCLKHARTTSRAGVELGF